LLLVMTRRALLRLYCLAGLGDVELHPVELEQQVVRELDVGLVDLVDQHDGAGLGRERLPEHAAADVVADVAHARVAELAVAQARDGVVLVEPGLGLGGRLDVPAVQRQAQRSRHLLGQHRLAGASSPLTSSGRSSVTAASHREPELVRRHVALAAPEPHPAFPSNLRGQA
jgi:hypothetical protein